MTQFPKPSAPRKTDRTRVVQLTSFLRERRDGKRGAVRFRMVPDRRGGTVPVVDGELLIRTADLDLPAVTAALRTRIPRRSLVPALGGAVTRIVLPESQRDRYDELLAALTEKDGVPVQPHAVVPMGAGSLSIVWKANSTPEHAPPGPKFCGTGAGPVRVAVLDTGVTDRERVDGWLTGLVRPDNVDPLDDFPVPDGYLDAAAGHGTFVAGIVRQVAPDVDLEVVRALDSDGLSAEVDVAAAMVAAVAGGAQVVNLSLGIETVDDRSPLAFVVALEQIAAWRAADPARRVVLVAAAGNSGLDRPVWPAALDGVVAVAALTEDGDPAPWSSRGTWVTCSTVGQNVRSVYVEGTEDPVFDPQPETFRPNAWAYWSGTSFAAPQVAAEVARLAQDGGIDVEAALERLLLTATSKDPLHGALLAPPLPPV